MTETRRQTLRFTSELKDFLRFVAHPHLGARLPVRRATSGWYADWFPSIPLGRLLQWALVLWAINLFFLGPLAAFAATAGGAQTRFNIWNIPWVAGLLWAPVVEELTFRYGLRHPAQALWLVPAAMVAMLIGMRPGSAILLLVALAVCWGPLLLGYGFARKPMRWRWRRRYRALFPWLFHFSCLIFAGAHLVNYSFDQTPYWLMPLLVLPQWLTGTVLGWMRVKRGVGASMLLHGVFNAGPLVTIWVLAQTVPQLLTT